MRNYADAARPRFFDFALSRSAQNTRIALLARALRRKNAIASKHFLLAVQDTVFTQLNYIVILSVSEESLA